MTSDCRSLAARRIRAGRFFLSGTGDLRLGPDEWRRSGGLRVRRSAADCSTSIGTHVDPSTIFNLSGGYTISAGKTVLQPEIYVENAFNKQYFLKGAFFSGASVGRPRSVQFRIKATFKDR